MLSLQSKLTAFLNANRGRSYTPAQLAEVLGTKGQEETIFKIGEHLAANVGRGVQKAAGTSPADTKFTAS